jgi:hypothetical protein
VQSACRCPWGARPRVASGSAGHAVSGRLPHVGDHDGRRCDAAYPGRRSGAGGRTASRLRRHRPGGPSDPIIEKVRELTGSHKEAGHAREAVRRPVSLYVPLLDSTHIFSALAQFERRLIQERTRAGLTAARPGQAWRTASAACGCPSGPPGLHAVARPKPHGTRDLSALAHCTRNVLPLCRLGTTGSPGHSAEGKPQSRMALRLYICHHRMCGN